MVRYRARHPRCGNQQSESRAGESSARFGGKGGESLPDPITDVSAFRYLERLQRLADKNHTLRPRAARGFHPSLRNKVRSFWRMRRR